MQLRQKIGYLLDKYPVRRISELKYRYITRKYDQITRSAIIKFKQCRTDMKKSPECIRREILICKKYWKCYPFHYFRYGLYRSDVQLTDEKLISFIPEYFFYCLFLSAVTESRHKIMLDDKNVLEMILSGVGIKQPDTLCKIIKGHLYTRKMKQLSSLQMLEHIENRAPARVFIKPASGQGGYGIKVLKRDGTGKYVTPEGNIFGKDYIDKIRSEDCIIQAGLIQSEFISRIYPDSVNTLRIATENSGGNIKIVCTALRMGRGGSSVDNLSQGGLVTGIDIGSGKCAGYAMDELNNKFLRHPDTGFEFEGMCIPEWSEIKNFTLNCAMRFPDFKYIGWDIALTKTGVLVVEANLGFSIDVFQLALGGMMNEFGIKNPGEYWRTKMPANSSVN